MSGARAVAGFLLGFGVVTLIVAPAVIWFYPVPDTPGGWCGSGTSHDGYAVTAICQLAFYASLLAAPVVVVSAAGFAPSRLSRVPAAGLTLVGVAPVVLFTWLLYGVKVFCAGS